MEIGTYISETILITLLSSQIGYATSDVGVYAFTIAENVTFWNRWTIISFVHFTMLFFITIIMYVNHF